MLTGSHNTTLRTKEHSLSFECCSLRNSVGVWGLQTIAPHLLGDKELRLGYDHITLILKLLIALTLSMVVSADNLMQNFNCTSEQFISFRHCKDIFIISHFPLQVSVTVDINEFERCLFLFKKKRDKFSKGCCRIFPCIHNRDKGEGDTDGQVLGGDEVSFSKPILDFPWLALSHALRRHLIESVVLKGSHCVSPQPLLWIADTFTLRMAPVEDAGILPLSLVSVAIVHPSEEAACSRVERRLRQTGA